MLKKIIWHIIPSSVTARFTWFDQIEALVANLRYGFPGRKVTIIGITGTDGKTSTTYFLYNILKTAGFTVGLINTIEIKIGDQTASSGLHVTTPDPWELNKILSNMVKKGCDYVVLEVSSHAIQQKRIWGIPFRFAGLTNITPEHRDAHKGSFKKYKETKLSFLQNAKQAFKSNEIDNNIISEVHIKLEGDFFQENAKLAAALAQAVGVATKDIKTGIEAVTHIPGRMDVVYEKEKRIIIDFAATTNSLYRVLKFVNKRYPNGRKIVLFGSASERDTLKRSEMGRIAAELADVVVLTAEDPRYEEVSAIIEEIVQGITDTHKKKIMKIPDRKEAIFAAIQEANVGDTVILCGKGHEKSMNIQGKEHLWDEYAVVQEALQQ